MLPLAFKPTSLASGHHKKYKSTKFIDNIFRFKSVNYDIYALETCNFRKIWKISN